MEKIEGFVCSCGEKKLDWLLASTPADLRVIYFGLFQDFYVSKLNIYADQWFAVSGQVGYGDSPEATLTVQCDDVEFGIRLIWLLLSERWPARLGSNIWYNDKRWDKD